MVANAVHQKLKICFATMLYVVQGVNLGLTTSIPLFLIYYGATWNDRGTFNFAFYPFSLKLFWAPLVDVFYSDRIGRRKSWIVPLQFSMILILLILSFYIESLIVTNSVIALAAIFFALVFLTATQDICADGLAISWFAVTNPQWASTSQTVGQAFGRLVGSSFLMTFESANFTNSLIRQPLGLSTQTFGLFSLEQFMRGVTVAIVIVTLCMIVFVHEKKEKYFADRQEVNGLSLADTYASVVQLFKKKCIRQLILISLLSPIGFVATYYMTQLALIGQGVSRENIALVNIPVTLVTMIAPLIISETKEPLLWFGRSYIMQLINAMLLTIYVFVTPRIISSTYYYPLLILILIFNELIKTLASAAYVGFFASITEPRIGGTYMTFLATVSNSGYALNSTIILYAADWLPKRYAYVIASGVCGLLGLLWYTLSYRILRRLQALPTHNWHLRTSAIMKLRTQPADQDGKDAESLIIEGR